MREQKWENRDMEVVWDSVKLIEKTVSKTIGYEGNKLKKEWLLWDIENRMKEKQKLELNGLKRKSKSIEKKGDNAAKC